MKPATKNKLLKILDICVCSTVLVLLSVYGDDERGRSAWDFVKLLPSALLGFLSALLELLLDLLAIPLGLGMSRLFGYAILFLMIYAVFRGKQWPQWMVYWVRRRVERHAAKYSETPETSRETDEERETGKEQDANGVGDVEDDLR